MVADIARSLAVPLPQGVSAIGASRATVTITIAQIGGAQRTTFGIQALNVPQRLSVRFTSPTVEVVLNGPIPALNALLPEDVKVTVDVAGRTAGTYTLPIRVQVPDGITVGFVQATTAEVTIGSQ